jgi:hypothetical protein
LGCWNVVLIGGLLLIWTVIVRLVAVVSEWKLMVQHTTRIPYVFW